jgi:AsmA protein
VLRKLNAAGDLKFGKAKFSGLTLTNASFGLTAANGKLKVTPKASLYGGTWNGQIDVDVQGNAAKATIAQQLEHVDLVPLGKDLLGSADVAGIGDVKLDLVASGSKLGEMRRGWTATVVQRANGALEGTTSGTLRGPAPLDDPEPERGNAARRTTFASLAATGTVEDAVLTNRDLTGVLDFMRLTGTGTVNLLDDKVSFDLKAAMIDGPKLQSDPAMVKYAGDTLPLRVTGTIDAPVRAAGLPARS